MVDEKATTGADEQAQQDCCDVSSFSCEAMFKMMKELGESGESNLDCREMMRTMFRKMSEEDDSDR